VFLDNDSNQGLIKNQLDKLVTMAREKGMAVGIGHARPNTLAVLKKEIPELLAEGFKFEFVSQHVK
jgi:polysaccharide deacetylase 2 family uncharacterized protein YibQ